MGSQVFVSGSHVPFSFTFWFETPTYSFTKLITLFFYIELHHLEELDKFCNYEFKMFITE